MCRDPRPSRNSHVERNALVVRTETLVGCDQPARAPVPHLVVTGLLVGVVELHRTVGVLLVEQIVDAPVPRVSSWGSWSPSPSTPYSCRTIDFTAVQSPSSAPDVASPAGPGCATLGG